MAFIASVCSRHAEYTWTGLDPVSLEIPIWLSLSSYLTCQSPPWQLAKNKSRSRGQRPTRWRDGCRDRDQPEDDSEPGGSHPSPRRNCRDCRIRSRIAAVGGSFGEEASGRRRDGVAARRRGDQPATSGLSTTSRLQTSARTRKVGLFRFAGTVVSPPAGAEQFCLGRRRQHPSVRVTRASRHPTERTAHAIDAARHMARRGRPSFGRPRAGSVWMCGRRSTGGDAQ